MSKLNPNEDESLLGIMERMSGLINKFEDLEKQKVKQKDFLEKRNKLLRFVKNSLDYEWFESWKIDEPSGLVLVVDSTEHAECKASALEYLRDMKEDDEFFLMMKHGIRQALDDDGVSYYWDEFELEELSEEEIVKGGKE